MTQPSRPWYRHLWPWLLAAPPAASLVGGFTMLWVAVANNDPLVTPARARGASGIEKRLTPEEAANCSVRDRACLNTPVEEGR